MKEDMWASLQATGQTQRLQKKPCCTPLRSKWWLVKKPVQTLRNQNMSFLFLWFFHICANPHTWMASLTRSSAFEWGTTITELGGRGGGLLEHLSPSGSAAIALERVEKCSHTRELQNNRFDPCGTFTWQKVTFQAWGPFVMHNTCVYIVTQGGRVINICPIWLR